MPPPSPSPGRAYLAEFCSARSETIPPLPWTNFSPPFTSFWATLKRAHKGVYHKISEKHLDRYVRQFAGKHNVRDADTFRQMQNVVAGMVGKRLMYRDLVA